MTTGPGGLSRSQQFRALGNVMRSRGVRGKLDDVADKLAGRAEGIADREGAAGPVGKTSGTRPKGRPYGRVTLPAAQEWGDSHTERRRILGRAVRGL